MECSVRKCWRCSADLSEEMEQCLTHSTFEFGDEYKQALLSPRRLASLPPVTVLLAVETNLFCETDRGLALYHDQENQTRCLGYFPTVADFDLFLGGKFHLSRDQIVPLTPELEKVCLQKGFIPD